MEMILNLLSIIFKGYIFHRIVIVMTWVIGNGLTILAVGIASLVMYSLHPTECGIGQQGNFTSSDGTVFTEIPGTYKYTFKRSDGTTGSGSYSGPGHPPLRDALFGTGIAYTIIGSVSILIGVLVLTDLMISTPAIIILLLGALFMFPWMIVLSVSLWRDSYDCLDINFPLWQMGMAATIISIVLVCTSGYGSSHELQNA
jgi:hypothetical protein